MLSRLVTFQNMTTAQFAEVLPLTGSGSYSGPVLDSTGLNGSWDFTLSFSSAGLVRRAERAAAGDPDPNRPVSFFDAIEAQLMASNSVDHRDWRRSVDLPCAARGEPAIRGLRIRRPLFT
jgi:hypothetical protein